MKKTVNLYYISGAGCVGKSSIADILISQKSDKYIILNGELCNVFSFPEMLPKYRKAWVDACSAIAEQTGRSVVWYGDLYPDAFNESGKDIYFVSLVCDDAELKKRIIGKYGEKANQIINNTDLTFAEQILIRNHVYSGKTEYQIIGERIDTTGLTAEQSADLVDNWIVGTLSE